eukprot:1159801-Pelagomonas_calceolata.AAC.6
MSPQNVAAPGAAVLLTCTACNALSMAACVEVVAGGRSRAAPHCTSAERLGRWMVGEVVECKAGRHASECKTLCNYKGHAKVRHAWLTVRVRQHGAAPGLADEQLVHLLHVQCLRSCLPSGSNCTQHLTASDPSVDVKAGGTSGIRLSHHQHGNGRSTGTSLPFYLYAFQTPTDKCVCLPGQAVTILMHRKRS